MIREEFLFVIVFLLILGAVLLGQMGHNSGKREVWEQAVKLGYASPTYNEDFTVKEFKWNKPINKEEK